MGGAQESVFNSHNSLPPHYVEDDPLAPFQEEFLDYQQSLSLNFSAPSLAGPGQFKSHI